jgi:hypothetical protein
VAAVPARCRAAAGCCELARELPAFLEASFDRLDAYLKDLQKGNPDEPHSPTPFTPRERRLRKASFPAEASRCYERSRRSMR